MKNYTSSLILLPVILLFISCRSHLEKGEDYFADENFEKAEFHFSKALKMDPNNWKILYNLARCKEELEKYDEATSLYTRSLDQNKNMATHLGRARCYEENGYYEGAIMDYSSALKMKRANNFEAFYGRGRCYIKEYEYYLARADLNEAIKIRPDHVNAYYHRSISRSQLRDNRGALRDMNYVLQHKRDFRQAHFNRGIIHQRMGNWRNAKSDFDKAIELKLRSYDVFVRRGLCYYELGNPDKACKDFDRAGKFNPTRAKQVKGKYCS